jgi:hypothetical protein
MEERLMIRSINYRVDEKSIYPSNKQWFGMQYEDGATEIGFDVSNMPSYGDYLWRIDFDQVTAGYSAGISEKVTEGKISRLLPYDMTRFGGDVQITLVGTLDGEIVYSIPVSGYLKAVQKSEPSEDKQAIDISSAEHSARQSAANAMDAAERAEISAEEAKKSEELTEDARRILEEGTEFVFMGGDAKSKHKVNLVVDDKLTEHGTNPVEGQVIFRDFLSAKDELRYYVQSQLSDLSRSLYDTIMNSVHPVGSIYISENATNPADYFGGSWKRITDTFILAAGDKFPIGDAGGKNEVTLTVENIPSHTHQYFRQKALNKETIGPDTESVYAANTTVMNMKTEPYTYPTGGDKPFSIMPPYVTRYVWQRTA